MFPSLAPFSTSTTPCGHPSSSSVKGEVIQRQEKLREQRNQTSTRQGSSVKVAACPRFEPTGWSAQLVILVIYVPSQAARPYRFSQRWEPRYCFVWRASSSQKRRSRWRRLCAFFFTTLVRPSGRIANTHVNYATSVFMKFSFSPGNLHA